MSTKKEIQAELLEHEGASDLEVFQPSPPSHRIDDKAATLEDELQDLKIRLNRERFLSCFIGIVLAVCLVGPSLPNIVLGYLIIASLIFIIVLAKYLDFPWAVPILERFLELLFKGLEKKLVGNSADEKTEPIDDSKK